jgi:site-specific DNA-methyltransferase (cytosine-N4-specific)
MVRSKNVKSTRLNRIHPYPAMIADECALSIASRYVKPGSVVLDPFCGTGRTLYAAASRGGTCFGFDVNPLAVLIAQAKNVRALPKLNELPSVHMWSDSPAFVLQPGRKVKWFTNSAERELNTIVRWINSLAASSNLRAALACVLSATVREVSFCRKQQWKLHRMSASARRVYRPSALRVFKRRLESLRRDLRTAPLPGKVRIARGDARKLRRVLKRRRFPRSYDVIFTSPPYGDSESTVSYGGMSSMCMGVLQHVSGINMPYQSGHAIDSQCLGGSSRDGTTYEATKKYWAGSASSEEFERVTLFLRDLAASCREIAALSHIGTVAIMVVARRSVRRRRLYIDHFLSDEFRKHGFRLVENTMRSILRKNTPHVIDRRARSRDSDKVRTMEREFILAFKRVTKG